MKHDVRCGGCGSTYLDARLDARQQPGDTVRILCGRCETVAEHEVIALCIGVVQEGVTADV